MQTNLDITRILVDSPTGMSSIHQISKMLRLPYGTAYNRVHALFKMGVLQILHQGKAKLCTLNPENTMTSSLLALGAAQEVDSFIRADALAGSLFRKIRRTAYDFSSHSLAIAILLTPHTLKHFSEPSSENNSVESEHSLDFFFVKSNDSFDEKQLEIAITSLMPPAVPAKITNMTVDRETFLGMLTERENQAGLAAYSMLHAGLILFGFENFYSLILEAFARKLSL